MQVLLGREAGSPDRPLGKSPFQLELEHFLRCAASGEEPIVNANDGYEALRISLAATESASTGKPVVLR